MVSKPWKYFLGINHHTQMSSDLRSNWLSWTDQVIGKQNRWKESAIFIVTYQDSPTDRTEAEGAGADEYFVKPVGIKLLDRSVQQCFSAS